jgi:UDP-N-acetylmuramoyl-L-alanyl-D-glutamate--2,6-diaminopimelate ligase
VTAAPAPPAPRTLGELARLLGGTLDGASASTPLTGLSDDSRAVAAGEAFFARAGSQVAGASFAADALERGAAVAVTEVALPGLASLRVGDVGEALRAAADAWYGRPQDALDLVGITGTKGKTTTSMLTAAALRHAGRRTAVIGTIAYDLGDGAPVPAQNTTPGVLELRRLLARARKAGCTAAVMEVSSHALDQGRTAGLAFRAGVFTNLASDHLDYHRTLEAYFAAKARLFAGLAPSATAVLNRDDPVWPRLAALCRGAVLTYGMGAEADLRYERLVLAADRTTLRLHVAGQAALDVRTPLVGRHNVQNLLAAVGAALALGVEPVTAVEGASRLEGVRGRLERVDGDDLHVFVDYAHTEDSLRQVLGFLDGVGARPLTCVVGCGGDRDRTKRPRMARVAADMAARAVFTSDNPRTEDPRAILDEMLAGLTAEQRARATVEVDRRAAIRRAVLEAPAGGSVLVAGKGHEDYQIVGTQKLPFDDVTEVREALRLRSAPRASEQVVGGPPRAQ